MTVLAEVATTTANRWDESTSANLAERRASLAQFVSCTEAKSSTSQCRSRSGVLIGSWKSQTPDAQGSEVRSASVYSDGYPFRLFSTSVYCHLGWSLSIRASQRPCFRPARSSGCALRLLEQCAPCLAMPCTLNQDGFCPSHSRRLNSNLRVCFV